MTAHGGAPGFPDVCGPDYRGRVLQDGQPVASVSSFDERTMLRELHHYAAQYEQEGPVRLETRRGKSRWKEYRP